MSLCGSFKTLSGPRIPPAYNLSDEPQSPLPIPPSILPDVTPESPIGESERSSKWRDLFMPLLTVLVVGLAMILGVLLGMHQARNRGEARALKQSESARSAGPLWANHIDGPRSVPRQRKMGQFETRS